MQVLVILFCCFSKSADMYFLVVSILPKTCGVFWGNSSGDKCNPKGSQKKLSQIPVGCHVGCV